MGNNYSKVYDMNDYKFVKHLSDTDLYKLFNDDYEKIEEIFGGYQIDTLIQIVIKHGDNDALYSDFNKQSCDDVMVSGKYVLGEFQNVMGGVEWSLFEKKDYKDEVCPKCGSGNIEWIGDAFGIEGYYCCKCGEYFDKPNVIQ